MNVEKLAHMANQIAANFAHGPHAAEAVADVADHLLRFWTPEMRAELAESHARGAVELTRVAALALTTAMRPGATPQMSDTGGDAG
jgi:NADH-dependant formate dehydrogenase delta subunit FdsD